MKKALIVFGGWPGHEPEKCNEILSKFLNSSAAGFVEFEQIYIYIKFQIEIDQS